MANTIISHRAAMPEDGRIYVPECLRQFLQSTLCARIEVRDDIGSCIAFYLKMHDAIKGQGADYRDGYLRLGQMCSKAKLTPPLMWRASTNSSGGLVELLLHADDSAGTYKAVKQR